MMTLNRQLAAAALAIIACCIAGCGPSEAQEGDRSSSPTTTASIPDGDSADGDSAGGTGAAPDELKGDADSGQPAGGGEGEATDAAADGAPAKSTGAASADTEDPKNGDPDNGGKSPTPGAQPQADKTQDTQASKNGADDPRLKGKLFRGGKQGDVIEISFDDLNLGMQADVVYRPFMLTDRAKELDGKRVRINGFILAADRIKGMKEFVVLRNTECKFGPGGQADHLLRVIMKKGETASYQTKPISIEGVLKLNPFPSPRQTWSVFDLLESEKIRTVRR